MTVSRLLVFMAISPLQICGKLTLPGCLSTGQICDPVCQIVGDVMDVVCLFVS